MTTHPQHCNILIITGELSGDTLGAALAEDLKKKQPDITLEGFGGNKMAAAGVNLLMHCKDLAALGIIDVLKKAKVIWQAYRLIKKRLKHNPPQLLILIDYPGLNLKFAKLAKRYNIPVLYYVTPKVWSWNYKRINIIKKCVDHAAVIFPFEATLFQKEGIPATYVGHPLVKETADLLPQQEPHKFFNLSPHQPIIGLFPGSRQHEIDRLLPVIIASSQKIKTLIPNAQFILPLASSISREYVSQQLPNYITITTSHIHDIMNLCDAAIAVSGTITLELALCQTPMVIIYKTDWLMYRIAKLVAKTKFIGLCNIIAQTEVAPELIQHEATAEHITNKIMQLLENPSIKNQQIEQLKQIKATLYQDNIPTPAEIALKLINSSH